MPIDTSSWIINTLSNGTLSFFIVGFLDDYLSITNKKNTGLKVKEKFLKTMAKEATRMSSLVNDLLSLTRIERIEHSPPSEIVELGKIIQEV